MNTPFHRIKINAASTWQLNFNALKLLVFIIVLAKVDDARAQNTTPVPSPVNFVGRLETEEIKLFWEHAEPEALDRFELVRENNGILSTTITLDPETNSFLDNRVVLGDTITYRLVAVRGRSTSDPVFITIETKPGPLGNVPKPVIIRQSRSFELNEGSSARFFVEAKGVAPIEYTWFFNGQKMPKVTQPGIQIVNLSSEHVGSYVVEVSNAGGKVIFCSDGS